tara:strand:+ start:7954 stop:8517 length:564 start_codon:yes stop_codon:yes gene_type:complete
MSWNKYLDDSLQVLHKLNSDDIKENILGSIDLISESISSNKALLVCGNGGSASDAMHITGELVGRFLEERKALNAISLSSNPAILTAWSNDYSYETVFSRQVEAHASVSGSLICISTSGTSKNVLLAAEVAKEKGLNIVSLTGETGGDLLKFSDFIIRIPSKSVPMIQQGHLIAYHYICLGIEKNFL